MTLTKDWKNWWTRNYNFLKHATQNVAGDMLVSKSGFEPRGTESRRSTTPSHGNMRLRLSSTETLKRVLVVPPTKIMFYYCHLFSAIRKHVFVWLKINPPPKRRELSILIDKKLPHAPMPRYSNPVSKNERLEFFPKKCSFLHVSSLTSSSMKKREDMQ